MGKSSKYLGVTLFKPTGKWRAQISMGGTTTSLGDHDTEEEAARAFDRAALNRSGAQAKTNFAILEYATELDQLTSMEQSELVQMLRSRARKSGTHTSNYRGVSLLRHTQKWHAQINVSGRQVHLGFYESEELAARAYDRAAINKGAREHSRIITNFDINDYATEISILAAMEQSELVDILAVEQARNKFIPVLQQGDSTHVAMMLSRPNFSGCSVEQVDKFKDSASRAVPKLQHLPRWGLPPASLQSPAGNNSARSTAINTARSVVVNEATAGRAAAPQPAVQRISMAAKSQHASPSQIEDFRNGADSGLDGGRTWDSDSLKHPRTQAQIEMTPRDTANSTVRAAGGDANDLGGMHTRSKRQRSTASDSVLHQEGMMLPQSQVEDFMGAGPSEAKIAKQESCLPAHTTTSSASRRSMNRRTKRAPQRAVI